MDIINFNEYLNKRIAQYQSIDVGPYTISSPYSMNNFGSSLRQAFSNLELQQGPEQQLARKIYDQFKYNKVTFGMYAGKATPEELLIAIKVMVRTFKIKLEDLKPEGLVEFLRLHGIGIDCAGFVYNVYQFAFSKIGQLEKFVSSLSWSDPEKHDVRHAGVFVFGGNASVEVLPEAVQPGDILLFKEDDIYDHIALIIKRDGDLMVAESTLYIEKPGIIISDWKVSDGSPQRMYRSHRNNSWQDLWANGQMEIRRLTVIDSL